MGNRNFGSGVLAALGMFVVGISALVACGGGGGGSTATTSTGSTGTTTSTTTGSTSAGSSTGSIKVGGGSCSAALISPNYLSATDPGSGQPNQTHWWRTWPIKVFFSNDPTLSSGQSAKTSAINAFSQWNSSGAFPGGVCFTVVSSASAANVTVKFTSYPSIPQTLGLTTTQTYSSSGEIASADIDFAAWPGQRLTGANGFTGVACHEFGHVLFLSGHSTDSADVMYYQAAGASQPDQADTNSIDNAYCGDFSNRGVPGPHPDEPLTKTVIACPRQ